MPPTRDLVIGIVGIVTILAAALGLLVVEGRTGHLVDLDPTTVPLTTTGTYRATAPQGTTGPGGICLPDTPTGTCAPARLSMDLRVDGLPTVAGAHYVAFLTGGTAPHLLGPLASSDGSHTLAVTEEVDARAYRDLTLVLATDPAPQAPGPLVVHTQTVGPRDDDGAVPLDAAPQATLGMPQGEVLVDQIGAFEVSATATATLTDVEVPEGWTLHAWFETGDDGPYVDLGTFEIDRTTATATLDARVERVEVSDVRRVLVTLEVAGTAAAAPAGFPAYHAVVS